MRFLKVTSFYEFSWVRTEGRSIKDLFNGLPYHLMSQIKESMFAPLIIRMYIVEKIPYNKITERVWRILYKKMNPAFYLENSTLYRYIKYR